jgi:hypothetical protein
MYIRRRGTSYKLIAADDRDLYKRAGAALTSIYLADLRL